VCFHGIASRQHTCFNLHLDRYVVTPSTVSTVVLGFQQDVIESFLIPNDFVDPDQEGEDVKS
jgi:hypothetical protein